MYSLAHAWTRAKNISVYVLASEYTPYVPVSGGNSKMTLFEAITLICKKSTQNSHFGAIFPVFIRYSHLPCSDTLARLCLVHHSQRDGGRGGYALRPKYSQISKSKNDSFSKSIAYYQLFPIPTRFFGVFWYSDIPLVFYMPFLVLQEYHTFPIPTRFFGIFLVFWYTFFGLS